ncbi:hypothetical protein PtB15_1B576 [Puccinia triticina]|nr:hypothetical protein PtB15_1B576 [Puccinia triticina]
MKFRLVLARKCLRGGSGKPAQKEHSASTKTGIVFGGRPLGRALAPTKIKAALDVAGILHRAGQELKNCAVGDSNPGLKLIPMEGFNANHYTNGACFRSSMQCVFSRRTSAMLEVKGTEASQAPALFRPRRPRANAAGPVFVDHVWLAVRALGAAPAPGRAAESAGLSGVQMMYIRG